MTKPLPRGILYISSLLGKGFFPLQERGEYMGSHQEVLAYVDGSYNPIEREYAYGVVITDKRSNIIAELSDYRGKRHYAKDLQEAGELFGVIYAIKYAIEARKRKITIFSDYKELFNLLEEGKIPRSNSSRAFMEEYRKIEHKIKIEMIHIKSGTNYFHNIADNLARESLGLEKRDNKKEPTYYAVTSGREVGIYMEYKQVHQLISKRSNSSFRKFCTYEEAREYYESVKHNGGIERGEVEMEETYYVIYNKIDKEIEYNSLYDCREDAEWGIFNNHPDMNKLVLKDWSEARDIFMYDDLEKEDIMREVEDKQGITIIPIKLSPWGF